MPEKTQQQQSGIRNVWFDSYNGTSIEVHNVDTTIPDLSVIVTVNPDESLHVLYNTNVFFNGDGTIEILTVYVSIDGQKIGASATNFGANHDHNIWGQISLQYSTSTLSPGIYNVSIIAFSTDSANTLYDMTLLVFTAN